MAKSIYLINPAEDRPGFHGFEVLQTAGLGRRTALADLATTTVAAMIPKDWAISLCDERFQDVDLEHGAEIIGITGKVSQRNRMLALADQFRARGKTVLIGGPYASLNPEDVRPHADILVRGEIENIAADMFAAIGEGRHAAEYVGDKPDLRNSPVPRWDLYAGHGVFCGQVQTSRGCPFECEFCDVIQYLGRKQRWKEPDQVVAELDVLYRLGYRAVFLADDNFTVVRRRAKALLSQLAEWNDARPSGPVGFSTQVSIDIARDPELLDLCARARFDNVFIGIETPNEASLVETQKRQNTRVDLRDEISKVVGSGISVMCGLIVGFDNDGPDIFERMAGFVDSLPCPTLTLGRLVAPMATPLHERMAQEGRLIGHDALGGGGILETNIVPKLMSSAQQEAGMRWLLNYLYGPAAVARRVEAFAAVCGPRSPQPPQPFYAGFLGKLAQDVYAAEGADGLRLLQVLETEAARRPDLHSALVNVFLYFCQARYLLIREGVWDPSLARKTLALAG